MQCSDPDRELHAAGNRFLSARDTRRLVHSSPIGERRRRCGDADERRCYGEGVGESRTGQRNHPSSVQDQRSCPLQALGQPRKVQAVLLLTDKFCSIVVATPWARVGQLRVGDRVALESPADDIVWLFHFNAIHHRGQLSTYLRPLARLWPFRKDPSCKDDSGSGPACCLCLRCLFHF